MEVLPSICWALHWPVTHINRYQPELGRKATLTWLTAVIGRELICTQRDKEVGSGKLKKDHHLKFRLNVAGI